jgi:biotin operon repressor
MQEPKDHPRRFDHKTFNKLDGYDLKILEQIYFLSQCQAKKSPTGAKYCTPSEKYLGKQLGISRESVSHHVVKLNKLGVLDVTHRRKVQGRWQTNLYKIVSWIWWRIRQATKSLRTRPHRVKPASHITTPVRVNNNLENQKGGPSGDFVSIKDTIKALQPALFKRMYPTGS